MPRLLRIFLPLVLVATAVTATTSAAPPGTTQNIGGWAQPALAGGNTNSLGFIAAQRSSNMVWVNDIIGGRNWISPIFGGGGGEASDYAFTKIGGVHYAIEAEYNNYRFIDLTNQNISCYDSQAATRATGCDPVVSDSICVGSQGDVAVYGDLLIRAHEGQHSLPWGDITNSCGVAGNETQFVSLDSFDADGDSFTLTQGGSTSIPITRGQNNTDDGIEAALMGGNAQQQVSLTGWDTNGDSFTLNYEGNTSAALVRGTSYTNNSAGNAAIVAALQGPSEVQTVALSNYTSDGRSYTLRYQGNDSHPIVRGQNDTANGIENAIVGGNEQQQVVLTGFNGTTDSLTVEIGGNQSAVLGSGGLNFTTGGNNGRNTNVANAINGIAGFAGTVSSTGAANSGFTLTFSGDSASTDAPSVVINLTCGACSADVVELAKGGTGIAGIPAGGNVNVGGVSDGGYTLTFSGEPFTGVNVDPFSVTNGTGGVTGIVSETTAGGPGVLPAGAVATLTGNPSDSGFEVDFSGALSETTVSALSVTNIFDAGGTPVSASVRRTSIGSTGLSNWPDGGNVAVSQLSDGGFLLTFSGDIAATDVDPVSVTNGTGGVSGTVEERIKGAPGVNFRGITLIDISDPAHPQEIKGVPMCGNTHTITRYYDDISDTLFILGTSGGGTTQPQWGLTTCPAFSSPFGSGFEEVVEIPLDHPENAAVRRDLRIAVGGNGNCHDVNVFEELHFMATACSGTGGANVIDMTHIATSGTAPQYPGIGFSWPGLQTVHSAAISWSGNYLYINGEPGGGGGGECSFQDDTNKPLIHILERTTGKLIGQWMLPRPQLESSAENCTTHTVNMAPFLDRNIMAWSGYTAGVSVIDFTNPKAPREIAFVDQLTLAGSSGLGCWTGYWYNDNLYCNELQWGQHVFTVDEPWWGQALNMDELNPQTATKLIRCQVSYTGGPKRAKRKGAVKAHVKVFGPAPLQDAWGAKVVIRAPGYYKVVKTGENGMASAVVRATRRGKLRVSVPAMENMRSCQGKTKTIARPVNRKAKRAR